MVTATVIVKKHSVEERPKFGDPHDFLGKFILSFEVTDCLSWSGSTLYIVDCD